MRRSLQYDVIVAGGGTAGVAAALGAARAGARMLLVERNPFLGGIATFGGVNSFCGFFRGGQEKSQLVKGAGQMVLDSLAGLGEPVEPWVNGFGRAIINYDLEMLKYALDCLLTEYHVDFLLHTRLADVLLSADRIVRALCLDDEGSFAVEAGNFVDATGDGNLARMAGAPFLYGEDGAVQAATLVMVLGGADAGRNYTADDVEAALKKGRDNGIGPMTKMRTSVWKSQKGESLVLELANYPLRSLDAESITRAECEGRKLAHVYVRAFRAYLPGMENCFLQTSGPGIGIRESRRIVGRRELKAEHILAGEKFPEERIGYGTWPVELHDDVTKMSRNTDVGGDGCYGIPLGCLRPRNPENLWCAGRNICADHEALASARVMGACFVTGQAARVAAALTDDGGCCRMEDVRKELLRQGAIL